MFGFIIKKIRKKDDQPKQIGEKLAVKLRKNSEKLSKFLEEKFSAAQNEFFTIKISAATLKKLITSWV